MSGSINRVVLSDGCELWAQVSGQGLPLVLCHGGPGLFDYLAPVAAMAEDICQVHRFDQRGSGRSCKKGPYSLTRFIDDLDELRRHFGHQKWIVGGHSWGANLSLLYALRNPAQVEAVVYVCGTGLEWHIWKAEYHRAAESRLTSAQRDTYLRLKHKGMRDPAEERTFLILNDLPNHPDAPSAAHLAEAWAEEMTKHEVSYEVNRLIAEDTLRLDRDGLIRECRALDVPVLIVHGEADPRPLRALRSMIEALPRAQLEVIPDAGHMPWLHQPHAFGSVLRGFLQTA